MSLVHLKKHTKYVEKSMLKSFLFKSKSLNWTSDQKRA